MHSSTRGPSTGPSSTTLTPLHRPWSMPLPGVGRAGRVRRAWGTGALVAGAFLLGASTQWAATAEASPQPPIPAANPVSVARTFCQWSYESHRTVSAFGFDVQAWRVKVRGLGTVSVDVPNRSGRQWVGIGLPKGHAEDDVRTVECKVAGKWRVAEPS